MCIEHEESTDLSTKVGIDRHVKIKNDRHFIEDKSGLRCFLLTRVLVIRYQGPHVDFWA